VRALVVGGGLIGSHLSLDLATEGHSVVVYSRSFNPILLQAKSERVELVDGELPPAPGLLELIEDADVVFCLVGSSSPEFSDADGPGSMLASVVPVTNVLDLMRRTSTRHVVLASSGGTVYGRVESTPTSETHPTRPISLHGLNSLVVEQCATFFQTVHGLEPIVLRFSNVYGPGQLARHGQGVLAAWCDAISRDSAIMMIGDGETRRDFVYVADAVAAIRASVRAAPGVYNVGGGGSWSLRDALALLEVVTGRQADVRTRPGRYVDVPVTHLDNSRIRQQTGWEPHTPLRDGLTLMWNWISARPKP
jgi:UDP-glucose 4-epimerase